MLFPQKLPVILERNSLESYLSKLSQQIKNTIYIVVAIIAMVEYGLSRLIIPHLLNLYQEMGVITPKYFNAINIVIILGGLLAISLTYLQVLDQEKINKLKETSDDQIIINQNLVNPILPKAVEYYIKLAIFALIISIAYPFYHLTSSF